jgi:hypothetical protein
MRLMQDTLEGARRRAAAAGAGMRVAESIEVNAPPALVWGHVSDPERYLHFMSGVTRWSVDSETAIGLGARYRMLLRVGSAEVGGLIEVVEFTSGATSPGSRHASTSAAVAPSRAHGGRTHVELRLLRGAAPGSPAGSPRTSRRARPRASAPLTATAQAPVEPADASSAARAARPARALVT